MTEKDMDDPRTKYLSIRIKPALRELIVQEAARAGVSQGHVVRNILAKHYVGAER